MKRRNWTREELVLALNLYLKLPFGKMHSGTPELINLANLINRTPSSISMRLGNFASVDPYHQKRGVGGLKGGTNQVLPIWEEFIDHREQLLFESERILAEKEGSTIERKFMCDLIGTENLVGESKFREVKTRVNQNIFRQIVLANYSGKCAISGIDLPEILVASHIIPWSKNEKVRLNPENGICLSSLYDKTFDSGLIGLSTNYRVTVSKYLKQNNYKPYYSQYFAHLENKLISLPPKYYPNKEFIEFHMDTIFQK